MNLLELFLHGLPYSLVMSAIFSVALVGGIAYNPEMMLQDYPPDVKAAYGPARNPNTRRQAVWLALVLLVVGLAAMILALATLPRPANFGQGYVYALVTIWSMMMTFNLIDLLLLDFPLVYLKPKQMVLPGTEGLKGYSDYGFHARGFLKGTAGITMAALVLALIPALLWLL